MSVVRILPEALQLDIYPQYGLTTARSRGLKKVVLESMPRHTLEPLRFELPLILLRWAGIGVRRRYRSSDNLLVNLGAGAQGRPGYVNVDVRRAPLVNCLYDCRKSLPFPDASVRGIFCEHFFEHIDYTEEVPYFLSECWRVLKDQAVLRLIVPDAGRYLQAFCNEGWEELAQIRPLDAERTDRYFRCQYNTKMELINVVFRQGAEHKFAWDWETLRFVLLRYGFSKVTRQECGRALMPELCLDQVARSCESLYVDAQK
jgi:predicted SAM-dependent methyltransferase